MKKIWLFAVLVLVGTVLHGAYEIGDDQVDVTSLVKDEGSIEVHFCPAEDCEQLAIDFLDGDARCAFYDLNLEGMKDFLLQKNGRIVIDEDNAHKVKGNVVVDSGFGLMHNKFCIVGDKVMTGSMNPTKRGATMNNNNLIFIESDVVASYYSNEFEELWNKEKNVRISTSPLLLDGKKISIYFCPEDECADKIVLELRKAEKSIHFMTFSFTHSGIANAIMLRMMGGVEVKGVFEKSQLNKYTMFDVMKEQGADVHIDGNKYNMHHKVFIVDSRCVMAGSMNPTKGGDERNDENLLIICDEEIALKFEDEFLTIYGLASNNV